MDYFSDVFLINLDRRTDRLAFMNFKLNAMHINPKSIKRIQAVDGHSRKYKQLYQSKHQFSPWYPGKINSAGSLGILLTWKKMLNGLTSKSHVLVFEDDIYFHEKFHLHLNSCLLKILFQQYDVVYLGANQKDWSDEQNQELRNGYYKIGQNYTYGAYGICINQKAIDLINQDIDFDVPVTVDVLIHGLIANGQLTGVVLYPNIVLPEVCESDNMGSRNILELKSARKWNLSNYRNLDLQSYFIDRPISLRPMNKMHRFVFIIASYNNKEWYRLNLNSIFMQRYGNWRAIYVNDASTDHTMDLVKEHVARCNMNDKFKFISSKQRRFQAYSRYIAYQQTHDDEYCILLDGDDWLYDEYVLTHISRTIKSTGVVCTYGGAVTFCEGMLSHKVANSGHAEQVIDKKAYRSDGWRTGHLRVMKSSVLKLIHPDDLLDATGQFITCSTDLMESWACLEMSGKKHCPITRRMMVYNRVNSIRHFNSFYNRHLNDEGYRELINQKIKLCRRYLKMKARKIGILIDINSADLRLIINKISHDISLQKYNLVGIPFDRIDEYRPFFKDRFRKFIIIPGYMSQSYSQVRALPEFPSAQDIHSLKPIVDEAKTYCTVMMNKDFDEDIILDQSLNDKDVLVVIKKRMYDRISNDKYANMRIKFIKVSDTIEPGELIDLFVKHANTENLVIDIDGCLNFSVELSKKSYYDPYIYSGDKTHSILGIDQNEIESFRVFRDIVSRFQRSA